MFSAQRLQYLQAIVILGGVIFSWSTLIDQLTTFYRIYGTFFTFTDCIVPNPLATPCFYGALAFVIAFGWSLLLIVRPSSDSAQKWLRNFLAFGVVFALSVLFVETVQYYNLVGGPSVSCSPGVHPLQTPCFVGLLFFAASFVLSWAAYVLMRVGKIENSEARY